MAKKTKNRARAAARGTAADPARVAMAGGERLGDDVKLKGVMTASLADEIAESSGFTGFSFKSSFLIAGAVVLGCLVIPYLASLAGLPVNATVLVALPVLLGLALALSRFYIDTDRGLCRGFAITFVVCAAVSAAVVWLLLYQGLLLF